MLNKKYLRLISFFIKCSGYLIPRPSDEYVKISKTIHPFLLGKRNFYYFYDLEKSLYGIRISLEVVKKIVAEHGKILFVCDSLILKPRFALENNINFLKWKRGSLLKSKDADLVLLSSIQKENLVEAHRKSLLVIGVGSSTMSNIAYPFNLNIASVLLSDWFFGALYNSCLQGKRIQKIKKKKKKPFSSLLGKGRLLNNFSDSRRQNEI